MSYPYRVVLSANIGQWAGIENFLIPSASYFEITHTDASGGGLFRSNQFASRADFSGKSGVNAPIFSLVANQNVFLRRFRLASTLSAHGMKIWQKGKLTDAIPTKTAHLSYFNLSALKVSDSSLYGELETSNVIYQLNEWEDINRYLWKPAELASRESWYFALSEFRIGIDCTDIAPRCIGEMLDLRFEIEVDL